jgi:hypothetical protein
VVARSERPYPLKGGPGLGYGGGHGVHGKMRAGIPPRSDGGGVY